MNAPRPSASPTDLAQAVLNDRQFARVLRLAEAEAGLAIPDAKRTMVQSRLARRLRALRMTDFSGYLDFVESAANAEERREMVSALTTNVSSFFRERHHFKILREKVLPRLVDDLKKGGRVRFWSAGCSTGQEPYSIAMSLLELDPNAAAGDIRILATDIDYVVLATARNGFYADTLMGGMPDTHLRRYFEPADDNGTRGYRAQRNIRDLVTFKQLNLFDPWPMSGRFDAIFCRNVAIYFSDVSQRQLWPRFLEKLTPEGWLFLGHSERIHDEVKSQFKTAGVTAYRRAP